MYPPPPHVHSHACSAAVHSSLAKRVIFEVTSEGDCRLALHDTVCVCVCLWVNVLYTASLYSL